MKMRTGRPLRPAMALAARTVAGVVAAAATTGCLAPPQPPPPPFRIAPWGPGLDVSAPGRRAALTTSAGDDTLLLRISPLGLRLYDAQATRVARLQPARHGVELTDRAGNVHCALDRIDNRHILTCRDGVVLTATTDARGVTLGNSAGPQLLVRASEDDNGARFLLDGELWQITRRAGDERWVLSADAHADGASGVDETQDHAAVRSTRDGAENEGAENEVAENDGAADGSVVPEAATGTRAVNQAAGSGSAATAVAGASLGPTRWPATAAALLLATQTPALARLDNGRSVRVSSEGADTTADTPDMAALTAPPLPDPMVVYLACLAWSVARGDASP